MEELINANVLVLFKTAKATISGTVLDINDWCVILVDDNNDTIIIPNSNVLYYKVCGSQVEQAPVQQEIHKSIAVFVDNQHINNISVARTADSSEVARAVYADKMIHDSLVGKVQKTMECFVDAVYITTNQAVRRSSANTEESFVEDNKNPVTKYLDPTDMVVKLTGAGKNNGKKM